MKPSGSTMIRSRDSSGKAEDVDRDDIADTQVVASSLQRRVAIEPHLDDVAGPDRGENRRARDQGELLAARPLLGLLYAGSVTAESVCRGGPAGLTGSGCVKPGSVPRRRRCLGAKRRSGLGACGA